MAENKPTSSDDRIQDDLPSLIHEIYTKWSDPSLSTAAPTAEAADIQSAVKSFFLESFQSALKVSSEAARKHLRMASAALELWGSVRGDHVARKDLEERPLKEIAEFVTGIEIAGVIEALRTTRRDLYRIVGKVGVRLRDARKFEQSGTRHSLNQMKEFLVDQEKVLTCHINWWDTQPTEWLTYRKLLKSKENKFPKQRLSANFESLERKPRLYDSSVASLLDQSALGQPVSNLIDAQDTKNLEELQSLQIYLEEICGRYSTWRITASEFMNSSTDIPKIAGRVDRIFHHDFQKIVNASVQVAKSGQTVGAEAIDLYDALLEDPEASNHTLRTFITATIVIAQKAKEDANGMIDDLRATRQEIFSVIACVDLELNRSGFPVGQLIKALQGLKVWLEETKNQLGKQEQFVTVLIKWWQRIEESLSHIEQSLGVLKMEDTVRKKALRKHWKKLTSKYNSYISSMAQLQDQFSFLKPGDSK